MFWDVYAIYLYLTIYVARWTKRLLGVSLYGMTINEKDCVVVTQARESVTLLRM